MATPPPKLNSIDLGGADHAHSFDPLHPLTQGGHFGVRGIARTASDLAGAFIGPICADFVPLLSDDTSYFGATVPFYFLDGSSAMKIRQIRNATLVIEYAGKRFLTDPWFGPKGDFPGFEGTPNSHLRNPTIDLPVAIEDLLENW